MSLVRMSPTIYVPLYFSYCIPPFENALLYMCYCVVRALSCIPPHTSRTIFIYRFAARILLTRNAALGFLFSLILMVIFLFETSVAQLVVQT